MRDTPLVATKTKSETIRVLIGVVFVVALVAGFIYVEPDGERVGTIDLHRPGALEFEAKAGDALTFPAEVTPSLAGIEGSTERSRALSAANAVCRSQVTVHAKSTDGATASTQCALSDGLVTGFSNSDPIALSVHNSCTLRLAAAGRWTLDASASWAPGLDVIQAHLLVHREHVE